MNTHSLSLTSTYTHFFTYAHMHMHTHTHTHTHTLHHFLSPPLTHTCLYMHYHKQTVHGLALDWGISQEEAEETLKAWYVLIIYYSSSMKWPLFLFLFFSRSPHTEIRKTEKGKKRSFSSTTIISYLCQ